MRRLDKMLCFSPKVVYQRDIYVEVSEELIRIGVLLKSLRVRENLTPPQFACKIQVSLHELSAIESGRRLVDIHVARRIARVFGVDYRYFLG